MKQKIIQLEQELKETKEFIAILQERLEKHDYYINRGLQLWEKVKLHPMVKTFLR